jgi:hypothetical protein
MGSQNVLQLTARRAEILDHLGRLESRADQRHGRYAMKSAIARLRYEADQLDKRIDLELQVLEPVTAQIQRESEAA